MNPQQEELILASELLRKIDAEIDGDLEREAIQHDTSDELTTRYAIEALREPDTTWGKHAVAKAWLKHYARNTGMFSKGEKSS